MLSKNPSYTSVTKDWLTYFVLCRSDYQHLEIRQVESIKFYFPPPLWHSSAKRPWPASLFMFLDDIETHTAGRTPLDERSARRRGRYWHNTQQSQDTNVHPLSGIEPGDLTALTLRLRPSFHWGWHLILLIQTILRICTVVFIQHEFISCSKTCSKIFQFLRTVFVLPVFLSSYVYLFYLMFICCTLCVFVVLCVLLSLLKCWTAC